MKIATTLALTVPALVALLAPTQVNAHGGLTVPGSRAIRTMGLNIDNTFGHPIPMRASYTNGKGGDCLGFTQDKNLQSIPSGKSKIEMRANDGANHVGLCTVYLVDPNDKSKKLQVGQLNDCMRSLHPGPGNKGDAPIKAEMTIDVPSDASKLPCDPGHCVLEFSWEAAHITPHEFYNNCADVKISGAGGGSGDANPIPAPGPAPAPAPSLTPQVTPSPAPVPAPEPKTESPAPAPAPEPVPAPAPAPAPSTGSSKYVYIGSHPDKAALTQWCNWNCPQFCPADMCKLA